jgi:catechol 2,3-dioxygenase-like lactoylglutathione lyase family enzyme
MNRTTNRLCRIAVLAALVLAQASRASAQLTNTNAPAIVAHFHLNVTSIDAHKKFWVDTLGGAAMKLGADNIDVVKFPGILIFLRQQPPTGPTRGTAFDHIGFAAPNVPALAAKIVAAGYKTTDGREPDPTKPAPPPATGTSAVYGRFAYLLGPDGAKIELVTADAPKAGAPAPPPLAYHHIHFINKQYVEMQQWYMKVFDATLRPGQTDFFIGADLPGVGYSLNFFRWEGDQGVTHVPTAGRVVDHVGFEVKNLEAFCKALEAKGVKLTQPYRKAAGMNNIGTAMITDPWGVSVELTEGLDKAY